MKWLIAPIILGFILMAWGEYAEHEYKKHCVWHVVPQGDYDCGN